MRTEIDCPHCKQISSIEIEVDSPSDYYPSTECEFCDNDLRVHPDFDSVVYDAVVDGYCAEAEYHRDCREDR